MSFCPLIRMPGTSLGPCILGHAAYGHVEAAGLRSDYSTQFGVRARIRLGSRVTRIGVKNRGQSPIKTNQKQMGSDQHFGVGRFGVRARIRALLFIAWPNL